MVSFDELLLNSGSPIYLQIIRFIKRGIVAGTVQDQEELPSRRVLSACLGVNPNTVQRAYRMLEEEGIIQSHTGAKSCVSVDAAKIAVIRSELITSDVAVLVSALKQMGVSKEEAVEQICRLWEEE